jgi:hypothetical protein
MKTGVLLLLIGSSIRALAQEYPAKDLDAGRLAEELAAFQDDNLNYEELYENYLQLLANPIDLNNASAEDLRLLNILSEKQIQNLIAHRTRNGNLLSVYELQAISDFDLATIYKIVPLVMVRDPRSTIDRNLISRITHEQNNYFISRYERVFEKSAGYKTTENQEQKFQGSNDKLYLRFRNSRPNDFSFGLTAEKDAGEKIKWEPSRQQWGADYVSFHAQVLNKKRIRNLIIGDYQAQFGQGLLLGGAFGLGKGGETVLTTRKSNVGFLPYTSINEGGYLHGIASTIELTKHAWMSAFYSNTHRDGSIDLQTPEPTVSSLLSTGFHRTANELAKRKNLSETNYGAVVQYKKSGLDAGIIFHTTRFGNPIRKNATPYNQFAFEGRQNVNTGMYLNYIFNNVNFFSEVARSAKGGAGFIAGMLISPHTKLDISLLYRKYDRDFYSFYTNAFSESTTPQNESGMYWGWKYNITRRFNLAGYADIFSFPWLRFRNYAPSTGHEWLARFTWQPSRKIILYAQVREESKTRNVTTDPVLYTIANGTKHNYTVNVDYEVVKNLRLRTRVQFSNYNINERTTSGMVALQDLMFSISKFRISCRHAVFATDDFDNRQYVYENDVWLAYSLPAYQGTGVRNYILIEYDLGKRASVWLRFARTRYKDQDEIGSGPDKIEGNTRNDIKLQVRFSL